MTTNDHHGRNKCFRGRLALKPLEGICGLGMRGEPSSLHILRAVQGVSSSSSEFSVQGITTRYYLFLDFNPRDDVEFSVLIHALVKIFQIGVVRAGFCFFVVFF